MYGPATESKRLNSARLTIENYAASRGSCCPHCQHEKKSSYGLVRWYIPIEEQIFIGWADPPWSAGSDVAAGFRCKKCEKLYWFHLSMSHVELLCEIAAETIAKGK